MIIRSNPRLHQALYVSQVLGLLAALTYLLGLQLQAAWSFTIDDMYITLRYAKHWAAGLGLLWNPGEPAVEGYSNFLFVLLAGLSQLLHVDPVHTLKWIGVFGLLGLLVGLYRLARLWVPAAVAYLPCIWLLAYRGQILWSVSGLETSVYQALLVYATLFYLQAQGYRAYSAGCSVQSRKPCVTYFICAAWLFFLASITRPEAPLCVLLNMGLLIISSMRGPVPPGLWRGLQWFFLAFSVCFLPYLSWKWHYYGRLLPNPVYCKAFNNPSDIRLDVAYLQLLCPFLLAAIPALWRTPRGPSTLYLWSPSILYILLCLGADPVVAFENRLFLPAWVLFLPCAALGLQQYCSFTGLTQLVGWCLLGLIPMFNLAQYQQYTQNPQAGERLRLQVVDWLQQHTQPGDAVLLADSGLIPYRSNLRFIDSYCLNNKHMTELPRSMRYTQYCQQVWLESPAVIILTAAVDALGTHYTPLDACLLASLSEHAYRPRMQLNSAPSAVGYYQYSIYTRDM